MNFCSNVRFLAKEVRSSLRAESNKSYPDLLNAHKAFGDFYKLNP